MQGDRSAAIARAYGCGPFCRSVEALAVTVPLYILLFAATYYGMAVQEPASFDVEGLTRVDTLYFTVTTFSSVGFGDISAASQTARILVTIQMMLNLLVLGAGIRVFVGAARRAGKQEGRIPHRGRCEEATYRERYGAGVPSVATLEESASRRPREQPG